jgi:hypothetical protein
VGVAAGRGRNGVASGRGANAPDWPGGRAAGLGAWPGDGRGLHARHHPVGLQVGEVATKGLLLLESLEQRVEVSGSKALERERAGELEPRKPIVPPAGPLGLRESGCTW